MKIVRPIVWTGTNVLSASAPNETAWRGIEAIFKALRHG